MAEHPAIAAARAAKGGMFQHSLVLSPHVGSQPAFRTLPTKADDPTTVLSAIMELGWELVSTGIIRHPDSPCVIMTYVWRRVGR